MKRLTLLTAAIVTMVMLSGATFAQDTFTGKCKNDKLINCNALASLKMGIESENPGVRRGAIYYAGEYKLTELTPALLGQLKREKDRSLRILIALSLYKMGDKEGVKAISRQAETDRDSKVRRMCVAISEEIRTGEYRREIAKLTSR